jgi:phospholipid/cholesterol/gamma-HCH transport system substrate-binding protein
METQARSVIVGLFTVVVAVAGFIFVYWLHGVAGPEGLALYRVRFDAPVIGLRPGVAVLFNGLRVGEVTLVRFDPADPKVLMAQIAVEPSTPVRQDTRVGIDAQGLMGGSTISLMGGVSTAPLQPGPSGEPPLLVANPDESQNLTQAAKVVLGRVDGILADNAKPLHEAIANISAFAAALARNSDRVDPILQGLEKMTGDAAPKAPPLSYDLSVPEFPAPDDAAAKPLTMQIAVPDPTALVAFDTQKVLVAPSPDALQPLAAGQWADSIPKLIQAKIVQSFENAGFAHIAKSTDGFTPDVQLLLEIRSFQVSLTPQPEAQIELFAKLLDADGKIAAARSFRASAPAAGTDTPAATAALNAAFGSLARDLVAWAKESI